MTTEADRLSMIEDHCQRRIAELNADTATYLATPGSARKEERVSAYWLNGQREAIRRELATVLNLLRGISLVFAVLFAGCALDGGDPTPDAALPTCESLGAAPNMNLFCNVRGYCVYDGQACSRGQDSGSATDAGNDDSAGSAASGGAP